jgi:hypothetical protein
MGSKERLYAETVARYGTWVVFSPGFTINIGIYLGGMLILI